MLPIFEQSYRTSTPGVSTPATTFFSTQGNRPKLCGAAIRCARGVVDAELMLDRLKEVERTCVEHLRQAQSLGVSLAEYYRSFDLDLGKWYRVKQALTRKGITVTAMSVAVAEEKPPAFARVRIVQPPTTVATAPVACRILHPSGWIVECGSFPPADWLAAVLSGPR